MSEFRRSEPALGEQSNGAELPAEILFKAIEQRLEEAVGTDQHRTSVDGFPYVNLQEKRDMDSLPGDIYRIFAPKWARNSSLHNCFQVTVDHKESVQPDVKVGDLQISEDKRAEMAGQGFAMGEEDEVIELKREYEIYYAKGFDKPAVRSLREVAAKEAPPVPEGHEGAWGWAQVVERIEPDSPELAEIAESVRLFPIKHEEPKRIPV